MSKVLGVLAGRDLAPGALEAWLAWADRVVAADGGADLCRAAGREPDAIVGDLDSIADPTGLERDDDQDTSDADKLLAFLAREKSQDDPEGFLETTLIGVEGDRLDHVLATLFSCARSSFIHVGIVLRQGMCVVVNGGYCEWRKVRGRVSVLPLGRCVVDLAGVRWPLHDAVLEPRGIVSLSNEVVGGKGIALHVESGSVALFLEAGSFPPSL